MAETVIMPKLGFDMAEGTLVRWVISEGQPVHKGAVLAEIETDKATVEVESNFEGIVARHLVAEKDVVPVNTPIAIIAAPGEQITEEQVAGKQVASKQVAEKHGCQQTSERLEAAPSSGPGPAVKASPIAKRLAREKGIDLSTITGTGPAGRIVKKDVESAVRKTGIHACSRACGNQPTSNPGALDQTAGCHRPPHGRGKTAGAAFLHHPRLRYGNPDGLAQADQRHAA